MFCRGPVNAVVRRLRDFGMSNPYESPSCGVQNSINPFGHMRFVLPATVMIAWAIRWIGIRYVDVTSAEFWTWPILSLQMRWGFWVWPLNAIVIASCMIAFCRAEFVKRDRGRTSRLVLIQLGALVASLVQAAFADRFGQYIGP